MTTIRKPFSSFTFNSREEFKDYIKQYCFRKNGHLQGRLDYFIIPHIKYFKSICPKYVTNNPAEVVYWVLNDLNDYPKCPICGNNKKFYKFKKPYPKTCSRKCSASSKEVQIKKKKTIKKKYGVDYILQRKDIMKKGMVKNYGVDNPSKLDKCKKKKEETCLKNYGVNNPSKSKTINDKKISTCLKNYGVEHPLQSNNVYEKYRNTCLERFGTENPNELDVIREKYKQTCLERYGVNNTLLLNSNNGTSKIANNFFLRLYNLLPSSLKEKTYSAPINKEFHSNCSSCNYFYDFVITSIKVCIEFNGDFWHMNPNLYNPTDYNMMTNLIAEQQWNKDKKKIDHLISRGYDVIVIWEDELNNNYDLCLKNTINTIKSYI